MTSPTIDFRSIREHDGDKRLGFEELVVQLIPWIDEDVKGHEIIRHGMPDGGVEAHVEFDDRSIWGWQAKYFSKIGDSQINQMERSLYAALDNHPTLTRYTFVLPIDPPSGKPARGESAQQKLDKAFARWKKKASDRGQSIDLRLIGKSRLVNILTDEEHTGRVLYWFDQRLLFSTNWLQKKLDAAIDAAGPRYTPEINVDLPIGFDFEGLGRTKVFERKLSEAVSAVARAAEYFRPPGQDSPLTEALTADVQRAVTEIAELLSKFNETPVMGVESLSWETHLAMISDIHNALTPLHMNLPALVRDLRKQELPDTPTGDRRPREVVEHLQDGALRIRDALSELETFLGSRPACLAVSPLLFLSGEAGTGKTHLLCDVAKRRLDEGRPTVLVMGEQIEEGNPRTLLPPHLDLPDLTMEQFLSALNTAGELAGTRALLMVDAINDGGGIDTWPPHLRSLAREIARYSHLGLVVSCRSSYVDAILSDAPDVSDPEDMGFITVEHRGFAGQERKAANTFFEYWNLALPEFPLLSPEYSNPLFLKLLCESLSKAGKHTLPRGATGITALFDGFLTQANRRLAHSDRCDYRREDDLVRKAVTAIARKMLESNDEWIPFTAFQSVCAELLRDREWSRSLANGLIDEGVVARDMYGQEEIARLSYQRLGDHLQAELLETRGVEGIRTFLIGLQEAYPGFYRHSGLLEALAVHLPEKLGVELHELVAEPEHPVIQRAFLHSIIWREPQSFPDGFALDYVNAIARHRYDWYEDQVLETLLQVACVPDHPFNAEMLHRTLSRSRLPDRDAWWTTYINSCSREDSAVYRIVDWARSPQQEHAADDSARLAAITLTWFLTASNRELRDCATKALVVLLRRRIPLLIDLLDQFQTVDDPYITERLYAVAYGCAMSTTDHKALKTLSDAVYDKVFAQEKPPVHIMVRDYARGVIEVAVHRHVASPHVNLALVRPPYTSSWPVRIPSEEQNDRMVPQEDRSGLRLSLSSMGDFTRYIVDPAVRNFVAPNQRRRLRERRERERLAAEQAPPAIPPDALWLVEFEELLKRLPSQPSPPEPEKPVMWTGAEAARWIFRRVLELGWTPSRFAAYDQAVGTYDRSSPDDRTERIGKKYQWIALHELLARIADHCRYEASPWEEVKDYDGAWQLSCRDIDPSLTVAPLRERERRSPATWWQPLTVEIERFADNEDRFAWAMREDDIPTTDKLRSLIHTADDENSPWVTLYGAYHWDEEPPLYPSSSIAPRGVLWLQVRSYLIPRRAFDAFVQWAEQRDWYGRWMPEGPMTQATYLGEWPWHPSAASDEDGPRKIDGRHYQTGEAPTKVLPTWTDYHWPGDGSLAEAVNRVVPARWLVTRAGLRWHTGDFAFDGPDGQVVALDPSAREHGPSALLFREGSLRAFLDQEDYSIVWTVLGEKNVYGDGIHYEEPRPEMGISGVGGLKSGHDELQLKVRTIPHRIGDEAS